MIRQSLGIGGGLNISTDILLNIIYIIALNDNHAR